MKRILAVIAVLLALGMSALAGSFYPVMLEPARLPAFDLPTAQVPKGTSLSALPTATMGARAGFTYRGGSMFDARTLAQTALLLRHPRGDLLLDTGLGRQAKVHMAGTPALMRVLSQVTLQRPAADQLAAHGYDARALRGIVVTHAHWDHISGAPDFPGVPLWLNQAERGFIDHGGRMAAVARGLLPRSIHNYGFEGGPYLGFPRSHDVWGDGALVLVPVPGHTPGSIAAFVTLPSGRRFGLVGDLAWQVEGIERPAERPLLPRIMVDEDPSGVRAGLRHVAALQRRFPQIAWLPAHDARAMAAVPVFPALLQ